MCSSHHRSSEPKIQIDRLEISAVCSQRQICQEPTGELASVVQSQLLAPLQGKRERLDLLLQLM